MYQSPSLYFSKSSPACQALALFYGNLCSDVGLGDWGTGVLWDCGIVGLGNHCSG